MRKPLPVCLAIAIVALGLSLAGCSQPAPAPTAAPAAPAKPAEPTKAPAAPAATAAPAPTKAAEPAKPTAAPAAKVTWPEKGKTITAIVPYNAGGPTDLLARLLAPYMEKDLGVPVQIVNKPGASTLIAMTEVANAKPDGYTLAWTAEPANQVAWNDPESKATIGGKNFQPIVRPSGVVTNYVVKSDSQFKTLKDIDDALKAKPESVKFATTGMLTPGAFPGYAFEELTGRKFAYVHFDGATPAVTAVLGGHADLTSLASSVIMPHVKSGAMRVIATFGETENQFFPGVPTAKAQGYNMTGYSSYGISGPAGMPKEVVDKIANAVIKELKDPEVLKKANDMAAEIVVLNTEQYVAWCAQQEIESKKWIELVRKTQK